MVRATNSETVLESSGKEWEKLMFRCGFNRVCSLDTLRQ